ncbi:hypothetical protein Tsubulata_039217 [Turnera subulata]|uniref:F-box domain-containing protein n=1 Tax=Turnera subulata TaxID=218843 RepID=A0A9Q0F2T4_9ROSI|nr:hypothetical protein Tsubulata_039217 [Turnera subulata]
MRKDQKIKKTWRPGDVDEDDQSSSKGRRSTMLYNHQSSASLPNSSTQLLLQEHHEEDQDSNIGYGYGYEDDQDKYPDLTHSLFDSEDLNFEDPGGSVIDIMKNAKQEGEEFRLEDEIDHRLMRLQKQLSIMRHLQEILAAREVAREVASRMESRKWEDLEINCLVNVLAKVGIESLLLDVPLVCKSWYRASLEPKCWEQIVSLEDEDKLCNRFGLSLGIGYYEIRDITVSKLIKLIIDRSNGACTVFDVSWSFNREVLQYLAEKCPCLKTLSLGWLSYESFPILPLLIRKWKHLEFLSLASDVFDIYFIQTCFAINIHCKNFTSLHIFHRHDLFVEKEISAIVAYLPKIKHLYLYGMRNEKYLKTILRGCRELEYLVVGKPGCGSFFSWELDEETMKLASHIKTFIYK